MARDLAFERAAARRLAGDGNLAGALVQLRRLVEATNDPEDRLALGTMAFVATDYGNAQAELEEAYRRFQAVGQPRRAALAATVLCNVYTDGLDEPVVGRGWRARALGLLEDEAPCLEKGYALLGPTGAGVANADQLAADAREALGIAQRFGDPDLECKALADLGLALVSMGRIDDGTTRLDEAFTMILSGECRDPGMISQSVCSMLSACERCGDIARAESWLRFIELRGAGRHPTAPVHTFAHCWAAFGLVLCQVGRWVEAETTLRMALARGERSFHFNKVHSRAALADLWVRQGRLEEASRLLDEHVDRVEVMGPRARLYLAMQRYDLAVAVAREAVRQLAGDRLRQASLLLILVEAELGLGDVDAAEAEARMLAELAADAAPAVCAAHASLALGETAAARGEVDEAGRRFEEGLSLLPGETWPLLRAALHLELARSRISSEPAQAIVHADAALGIYQRLGAPEASMARELLRTLGVVVRREPDPPSALAVLSPREREVLTLLAEGLTNRGIATRLFITAKTAEHHVGAILRKLGLRNRAEAAAFAASFSIVREAAAAR